MKKESLKRKVKKALNLVKHAFRCIKAANLLVTLLDLLM